MSTSLQPAPSDAGPRRGLPRWAWVLIGLLTVIAIVASAVAVFAARGRQVIVLPPEPAPVAASTAPAPSSSAAAPSSVPVAAADGCLGGATELDRAVLTAQRDAPLTPEGAAAFTATMVRWAVATPPPPYRAATVPQVLAQDATTTAQQFALNDQTPAGALVTIDFTAGQYYVEAFDGQAAIVSWVGSGTGSLDGVPQDSAAFGGAAHLVAQNGTWHLADISAERDIPDLRRIGTRYAGGC